MSNSKINYFNHNNLIKFYLVILLADRLFSLKIDSDKGNHTHFLWSFFREKLSDRVNHDKLIKTQSKIGV